MGGSHSTVEDVAQAFSLEGRVEQEYDDFRKQAMKAHGRGRRIAGYSVSDRENMRSFIAEYNREMHTSGYLRLQTSRTLFGERYHAVFDTDPSPA